MCLRNQKNNVIFRNRKATLMGYFDTLCLLFDKKDGKLDFGEIKILENYPRGYHCVFFSQIPVEERRQIRFDDGRPLLQGCVCSLFIDDKPNSPLLDEYVEIIGEDPIDYEIIDDYADDYYKNYPQKQISKKRPRSYSASKIKNNQNKILNGRKRPINLIKRLLNILKVSSTV